MSDQKEGVPLSDIGAGIEQFFSRRLLRLQSRVESMQVKMGSLGKVVRLLQQYTERKDQQYEKEANNFELLHHELAKIQDLQARMSNNTRRWEQTSEDIHGHSLKIEQITVVLRQKEALLKDVQEKFSYEMQEMAHKLQRLENGVLQQMREEGRRHAESATKPAQAYNFEEINFKVQQMEQSHKADYEKLKHKLDKIIKKHTQDQYGLQEPPSNRIKLRQGSKKKVSSLLKRVKSK